MGAQALHQYVNNADIAKDITSLQAHMHEQPKAGYNQLWQTRLAGPDIRESCL